MNKRRERTGTIEQSNAASSLKPVGLVLQLWEGCAPGSDRVGLASEAALHGFAFRSQRSTDRPI